MSTATKPVVAGEVGQHLVAVALMAKAVKVLVKRIYDHDHESVLEQAEDHPNGRKAH